MGDESCAYEHLSSLSRAKRIRRVVFWVSKEIQSNRDSTSWWIRIAQSGRATPLKGVGDGSNPSTIKTRKSVPVAYERCLIPSPRKGIWASRGRKPKEVDSKGFIAGSTR